MKISNQDKRRSNKKVSLILPIKNIEEDVYNLFFEIRNKAEVLGYDWEVMFVDTGSTDNTLEKVYELVVINPKKVRVIQSRGNSIALKAISKVYSSTSFSNEEIIELKEGFSPNDLNTAFTGLKKKAKLEFETRLHNAKVIYPISSGSSSDYSVSFLANIEKKEEYVCKLQGMTPISGHYSN